MSLQPVKNDETKVEAASLSGHSPCRRCGKATKKEEARNEALCQCKNGLEATGDGSIRLGPVPEEAFRRSPSPRPEASTRPLKYEIVSIQEKHGEFRKAIPCMPLCAALICCLFNVFLPGIGTFVSGLTVLCGCRTEQTTKSRALGYNMMAAFLQLLTAPVIVGWVWSVHWGILFVNVSVTKALQDSDGNAAV